MLTDNGGDNLTVPSGATSFTFAQALQSAVTYAVAVATQPTGETCTVSSASGTVSANVTNVAIACTVPTFSVSGSVSGLTQSGLKLQDTAGGEIISVAANATQFAFTQPVPSGTDVNVTVNAQPFWQYCTAGSSNFSGPISANVTTDTFSCAAAVATGSSVTGSYTFSSPAGVAIDSSGNLYVADSGNNNIVEISPTGTETTLLNAGNGLSGPEGVAVDASGNVYVANTNANEVLEDSNGSVTQLAPGFTFDKPAGIAVTSSGTVYVADTAANEIVEISGSSVKTFGPFNAPEGVAVDSSGNVYVANTAANNVLEITGGTATPLTGTYDQPFGVAVDSAGDVYVADTDHFEIRMITAQGTVQTVAGSTTQGSCTASPPLFHNPFGVAVDASGNLYVSDFVADQVCKLTPGP